MLQRAILTDDDVQPLAEGVLEVLDRVGILCQSEGILNALDAAGAIVDRSTERVTFPGEMVEEYLGAFRAMDHYPDLSAARFTPPGRPGVNTSVAQLYYDHATGETRSSCAADMVTLTKLGEVTAFRVRSRQDRSGEQCGNDRRWSWQCCHSAIMC